jgi:hypothetical protein
VIVAAGLPSIKGAHLGIHVGSLTHLLPVGALVHLLEVIVPLALAAGVVVVGAFLVRLRRGPRR